MTDHAKSTSRQQEKSVLSACMHACITSQFFVREKHPRTIWMHFVVVVLLHPDLM